MNHQWNRLIYKAWAPIYDRIFNRGPFIKARKELLQTFPFEKGQSVLLVGVGTGADLEFMPVDSLQVTAIDYSPDMLRQAKKRFAAPGITFAEMDAQHLDFEDGTFDSVVASLILSVVPDSRKAFSEMIRVVKHGGSILIFDKFAPPGKGLSFSKKLLRPVVGLLGTDIGVRFEEMLIGERGKLELQVDEGVMFNGMYRKIVLKKS